MMYKFFTLQKYKIHFWTTKYTIKHIHLLTNQRNVGSFLKLHEDKEKAYPDINKCVYDTVSHNFIKINNDYNFGSSPIIGDASVYGTTFSSKVLLKNKPKCNNHPTSISMTGKVSDDKTTQARI